MADTPATVFAAPFDALQTAQSGGKLVLPAVTLFGGRLRQQIATLTLASQAAGTVIWVARLPLYAALRSIDVITDTSLSTATIKFGDAHNGNSAIYGAAATLTSTNALTRFGPPTALTGVPITTGYDHGGILVTPAMPMLFAPDGGSLFEDIIMTTATAALPSSGTLRVLTSYTID